MSKKNNKGYFLVETIIVLTIVSTIITTLYVNSMNNYIKEKNELTKYNTVDGLYSANAIKKYLFIYEDELIKEVADKGYVNVNNFFSKKNMNINDIDLFNELGFNRVYLSSYDMNKLVSSDELNSDMKNSVLNEKNDGKCIYRYLVIYNDYSYGSVGLKCVVMK